MEHDSSLLELSIENYRSFLTAQSISLLDNKESRLVTAFYGANSAGKSNTALALSFITWFVRNSSSANLNSIPYEPFLLNQDSPTKETSFRVVFKQYGKFLEYGFSFNRHQIVEEYLNEKTSNERRATTTIFKREFNKVSPSAVKFGFGKQIIETTRPNSLLITKAYENNNDYAKTLFAWLDNLIVLVDSQSYHFPASISYDFLYKNPQYMKIAEKILHDTDFSIRKLLIEEEELPADLFNSMPFSDVLKQSFITNNPKAKRVSTVHAIRDDKFNLVGTTEFDLVSQESHGTNKFVKYLGPIIDALENGKTLYIDEFGSHLHPDISNTIIKLFKSKKYNLHNAQLIINTHETSLMPPMGTLAREDIIIIDKEKGEQSAIKPLTKYGVRSQDAIERRYRGGLFGGRPIVTGGEL